MIGTSISRYDILEELGQGGMSVVYLARDTALNREVAVKILHNHLAKKPENRARFRREAEAIARLSHPNILDVYDVSDESDDRSFIVMEYIPGWNLREFIDTFGPPPPEIAALIGVEICNALSHAHQHGVIHRDLKPENVMISEDGEVKLMDFGIAHVIDAETMTKTGSLLGSPAHMAPELIDGKKVDERGDVFALGTVIYWMATGQLPFCGDNAPQVLRNVMECRYEPPEAIEPRLSHDLARIICRSLRKEPEERFASVDAYKRELLATVHAVGVEEGERVLANYFAAPRDYADTFTGELVPRLISCGQRAVERGQVPTAIAYFNRVLAYDPGNEEVRECLARLDRSRRNWKIAGALAAAIALGSAGWLVWDITSTPAPPPAEPSQPQTLARPADGASEAVSRASRLVAAKLEAARSRANETARATETSAQPPALAIAEMARNVAKTHGRQPRSGGPIRDDMARSVIALPDRIADVPEPAEAKVSAPDSKPAEKTYTVGFRLYPTSAQLRIDGRPISLVDLKNVELTQGRHDIYATAPGCEPLRDTIVVNGPRDERIPVVLDWKDARINVVSNTEALVFVGNEKNVRNVGRRSTIPVEFERGSDPTGRTVHLRVADKSNVAAVKTRDITVGPGDERTVRVTFP